MDLLSASQIDTFDSCERKWAWKYIARVKTPQHTSAALGTEIDDTQLQPFLREGRPLDFSRKSGEIAQSIVQWIPPQGSCGKGGVGTVQQQFVIPSPTYTGGAHCGVGYLGYTDLWMPNGGLPGLDPLEDGSVPPVVVDFKSTGDLKWAQTTDSLRTNTQSVTYAFWAAYATRKPVIDLVWLYMRTKGARQGKRVHLRVNVEDAAREFLKIDERAQRIHALKKTLLERDADPLSLPPTTSHCHLYGGCPYQDRCNLGPGDRADSYAANDRRRRGVEDMNVETSGLLARLKAQSGVVTVAPAPIVEAVVALQPTAVVATPWTDPNPIGPTAKSTVAVVGINPPESALPPAPPVGTKPAAAKRPAKLIGPVVPHDVEPTRVRVVWGAEKISPISYNAFDVGPFETEGVVLAGETVAEAMTRLYTELSAYAEKARDAKAVSFVKALSAYNSAGKP